MHKKLSLSLLTLGVLFLVFALTMVFDSPATVSAQGGEVPEFMGSRVCGACHNVQGEQQKRHGHSFKLNRVEDGEPPQYPYSEVLNVPEGYSWDDVSFVIGGYAWKARFIDQDGYIITGDADATTQYNFPLIDDRTGVVIAEEGWVAYHAGEQKPYDCGACHTTGYNHNPNTHMYDMPGIKGKWEEEGIQCEECHGPGSLHVRNPIQINMLIDRSSEACGSCHSRDAEGVVEAGGGFIKHHEQFEELQTNPHAALECVDCHNPHQSAVYADEEWNPNASLVSQCSDCHFAQKISPIHRNNDVTCVDCHMAPIVASGNRNADLHWGDVSSHLYQINTDPGAPQFNEDGSAVMPYITVEYACTRCHADRPLAESVEAAQGYHD